MEMVIVLVACPLAAVVVRTFVTVLRDGCGHTPHPPSHADWMAGELPSTPYSALRF